MSAFPNIAGDFACHRTKALRTLAANSILPAEMTELRQIRLAKTRDLLWIVPVMLAVWMAFAYAGLDSDTAFLLGMSSAVIAAIASVYWDARKYLRFWFVLSGYFVCHIAVFTTIGGNWIPERAGAITPLFLIDFVLLGLLFPKLTGIAFDTD